MTPAWRAAWRAVSLAACLVAGAACRPYAEELSAVIASPTASERSARLTAALASRDSGAGSGASIAQWLLPPALSEISGLTLTHDDRLLVHNDEVSQVWEVDYRRGVLVKRFSLGNGAIPADFEAIASARDATFLMTSEGVLYEFAEGANDAEVEYKVHDTGLKKECEFEAVTFDSVGNSLLLVCKEVFDKSLTDAIVIYRWRLDADRGARVSRLTVPLAAAFAANGWKKLSPSDISVDPATGNYVLVASLEQALISITPAGAVVFARPLPPGHLMAEGVAITKDGILIVSDEAGDTRAAITLYRWP